MSTQDTATRSSQDDRISSGPTLDENVRQRGDGNTGNDGDGRDTERDALDQSDVAASPNTDV